MKSNLHVIRRWRPVGLAIIIFMGLIGGIGFSFAGLSGTFASAGGGKSHTFASPNIVTPTPTAPVEKPNSGTIQRYWHTHSREG